MASSVSVRCALVADSSRVKEFCRCSYAASQDHIWVPAKRGFVLVGVCTIYCIGNLLRCRTIGMAGSLHANFDANFALSRLSEFLFCLCTPSANVAY